MLRVALVMPEQPSKALLPKDVTESGTLMLVNILHPEKALLAIVVTVLGIDMLVMQQTGMPVHIAERPLDCMADGAGKRLGKR